MAIKVSNLYLILFQKIKGVGLKKLQDIYDKFGDFQRAYNAPLGEFEEIIKEKRISYETYQFLNDKDNIIKEVKKINKELNDKLIKYISYFDNEYPKSLRKIKNPPIGLYFKGNYLFDKLEKSISIVGTRNPSSYGHSRARSIARELAENDYIIVSGLARGIDMEAHLGALEGKGKTIAVLGSGVEIIYPSEHKNLAQDIIEHGGAIISEVQIYQRSYPSNLINRNRIISGISKASLIIEGDLKSGTRHEANFAKQQSKFIFALRPLDSTRKASELPLSLIENGTIGIETSAEIIKCLNANFNKKDANDKAKEGLATFL